MATTMWRSPVCFSNIFRVVTRQKLPNRRFSVGAIQTQEDEVHYPPIKPKYPPGNWSEFGREYAWQMYNWEQEILEIPSVQGQIDFIKDLQKSHFNKLYNREEQFAWFFNGKSFEPRLLTYQYDKTKTLPVEGLPSVYDKVDVTSDLELITPIAKELILRECENIQRRSLLANPIGHGKERISKLLIKSLILKILSIVSCSHPHLLTAEFSEDVFQQAYWDRYSDTGLLPNSDQPKKKVMKYQGECKTSFQLRTVQPLPEFVGRDSDSCLGQDYPKSPYNPAVLGQIKEKCTPHFLPGVNIGSPCEFGYLSVETVDSFLLDNAIEQYKSCSDIIPDLWKGFALSSCFLSTVAQAHYQGFNTYHDMTYPLTSQTIVTDGRKFVFSAYQLNTLHLWRSDDSNPLCNLFWYKDMDLFDGIKDGELVGFNDEVLKTLLKFVLLGTPDRGYNLKPTISITEPTQTIENYVPVEEVIERVYYDVDQFRAEDRDTQENGSE